MKQLHPSTREALKHANSFYKPKGFQTSNEIRAFWVKKGGAYGFLNIKEITPQMVREIRAYIIHPKRAP